MAHAQTGGVVIALADLFGEDVIDESVRLMAGLTAQAAHIPIIHQAAGKLLSFIPIASIPGVAHGFKLLSRSAQAVSKRALRSKLEAKGVNKEMAEMLVDTIDDTFEAVTRHVGAALTQENVAAYVAASTNAAATRRGIPSSITPSATAHAAANHGANMSTTPHVSSVMPLGVAAGTPEAQSVLAELWSELIAAIGGDNANERAEARRAREGVQALLRLNEAGAMAILNGVNHGVDKEACKEVFLAAADAALVSGPSMEAKLGDLLDRLVNGGDRSAIMEEVKNLTRTGFEVGKAGLAVSGVIFLGLGALAIFTGFLAVVSLAVGVATTQPGDMNVAAFIIFGVVALTCFVCVLIMGQMIEGAITTVKWMLASASAPVRRLGQLFDAILAQYLPAASTAATPHT